MTLVRNLSALFFGSLILGVVASRIGNVWPQWSRGRRQVLGASAVVVTAVAIVTIVTPTLSPDVGQPAVRNQAPMEDTGWSDASGGRAPIPYRDDLTPWADQASFNRLVGVPNIGDSRNFLGAKTYQVGHGFHTDRLSVAVGDTVLVRAYIINNAEPVLNEAGGRRGLAINTRLLVHIPTGSARSHFLQAWVMADNAEPRWISDVVELAATEAVHLTYLSGSVEVTNNVHPSGHPIDDGDLVTSDPKEFRVGRGALIGYETMNGEFLAGFDKSSIFALRVRVDAVG